MTEEFRPLYSNGRVRVRRHSPGFWMVTGGYRMTGYCSHNTWDDAILCALNLPPWSFDEAANVASREEAKQ